MKKYLSQNSDQGEERERRKKKKKVLSSYILERLCHSRDKNEDLNNKKK